MDLGFKFGIGSVVRLALHQNVEPALRGVVFARTLRQTSSGIERRYECCVGDERGAFLTPAIVFDESELVASEPFPSNVKTEEAPEA